MYSPYNTGAFDPNYYPEVPYAGLYDYTSGPAEDDAGAELVAEYVSEAIADEVVFADSQGYDTGAMAMPNLGEIFARVQQTVAKLGIPLPLPLMQAAARKVSQKVQPKIQVKRAAPRPMPAPAARPMPAPRQPVLQVPRSPPIMQPVMGPVARGREPIKSIQELMQRVEWCQLCNLVGAANGAVTLGIGATNIASVINVTRSGWVFDWSTNLTTGFVLANGLTYEQLPNTIFAPTPLHLWGPQAANPSPIEPLEVNFPATFAVNLTNVNPAAAEVVVWQMSGIPRKGVALALRDADVVAFLAARGWELAKSAQAGSYQF